MYKASCLLPTYNHSALVHSDGQRNSENPKSPSTHLLQSRRSSIYWIHSSTTRYECSCSLYISTRHSTVHLLVIFRNLLATTVGDIVRHQLYWILPMITSCLLQVDHLAFRVDCLFGLCQARKLLCGILFLSLSLVRRCSEVHEDLYCCTRHLQSNSPRPQLTYLYDTSFYLRHGRERLDTRLALYLAGTGAMEDWVVRAAAVSGCV